MCHALETAHAAPVKSWRRSYLLFSVSLSHCLQQIYAFHVRDTKFDKIPWYSNPCSRIYFFTCSRHDRSALGSKVESDLARSEVGRLRDLYAEINAANAESSKPVAPIDFAGYKSKISDPTVVDTFQKQYESMAVPKFSADVAGVCLLVYSAWIWFWFTFCTHFYFILFYLFPLFFIFIFIFC